MRKNIQKNEKTRKRGKNHDDLTTVEVFNKSHAALKSLASKRKLIGQTYNLYEVASEAIDTFVKKESKSISNE